MIPSTLSARRIGPVLSASPGGAATIPWWLSGGVSAANAIGVYQPIGAASLAASYTNLANPGTYNAAPGVAPTWASGTGWTFNGTTQYLTTGVIPASTWSVIARYVNNDSGPTDGSANSVYGKTDTNANFFLWPSYNVSGGLLAWGSTSRVINPPATNEVTAIANGQVYRDGMAYLTQMTTYAGVDTRAFFIGALNTGTPGIYFKGTIQAFAIYNATLTGPQVLAISNAMAALT